MKLAKNLATFALFLAAAVVPAVGMLACDETKPPMTPDQFAIDDSGAMPSLPSTDSVPTSLPSMPSAGQILSPPK